jgi:hypothetical protein
VRGAENQCRMGGIGSALTVDKSIWRSSSTSSSPMRVLKQWTSINGKVGEELENGAIDRGVEKRQTFRFERN